MAVSGPFPLTGRRHSQQRSSGGSLRPTAPSEQPGGKWTGIDRIFYKFAVVTSSVGSYMHALASILHNFVVVTSSVDAMHMLAHWTASPL